MSRTESLFNAVVLLSASAVFFRVLFVGGRLPRERWWMGERWLCDIWAPILLIGIAFSVDFTISAAFGKGDFLADRLHALYAILAAATAAAAWILIGRLVPRAAQYPNADDPAPDKRSAAPLASGDPRAVSHRRAA